MLAFLCKRPFKNEGFGIISDTVELQMLFLGKIYAGSRRSVVNVRVDLFFLRFFVAIVRLR
ncbi:MAG: hypothetical protein RLZZ66_326 [Pseudomonadota bacterium]|jgi:hypothetical protein